MLHVTFDHELMTKDTLIHDVIHRPAANKTGQICTAANLVSGIGQLSRNLSQSAEHAWVHGVLTRSRYQVSTGYQAAMGV